jgi:hypothetical protein
MGHDEVGGRTPLLHEELVVLSAPTQVWSHHDGSMGTSPVHGVFHGEWRYLRDIELRIDGERVEHLGTTDESGVTVFHGLARGLDDAQPDAHVVVERTREVLSGAVIERATLVNGRDVPVAAVIELACEIGFARLDDVRSGASTSVGIDLRLEDGAAIVTDGTRTLRVRGRDGEVAIVDDRVIVSRHRIVRPGDWCTLELELELEDLSLAVRGVLVGAPCTALEPTGRRGMDRWIERAVTDIEDLLLDAGHGAFPAAGAPWHLTMSAREALTASRLMLPLGLPIAEGTLRTLAARQGVRHDPATGEEPGRILHEMRQHWLEAQQPVERRPRFTGTLDETPLWIVLLHDAWRAGLPLDTVRELRPSLHAALSWLEQHAATGFLQASAEDDRGASRVDAALQALACRAAMGAAAMLDALGDDGDPWRAWAEGLRRRFRASFHVPADGAGRPAIALDAAGAPVRELGASLGHLLGTTLLDPGEERVVARLLLDDRLSSGFGLRSLADDADGYWPMADDSGAVRPVDTAIAIEGLLRIGLHTEARQLAEQLERAADAFHGRMPEAYGGYAADETGMPIALPGAGSPQACSAAAVVPAHRALTAPVEELAPPIAPMDDLAPPIAPIAPSAAPSSSASAAADAGPAPRPGSAPEPASPRARSDRGDGRAPRGHLRPVGAVASWR